MPSGQGQHGITKQAAGVGFGRDEFGRAGGMEDILIGCINAFEIVTVEQRFWRLALHHGGQLSCQIVGVLNARIRPARAERTDLMRRIAGKDHPPMAEFFHPAALEGVD